MIDLRRVLVSVFALAAALVAGTPSADAGATSYRVIVHHQVKGVRITRGVLASIFLKQAPTWTDGTAILPVDQSVRSPVRRSFSADVLQQGIPGVQFYWQRRMSQGITPPPVKATDEEIVVYVASTPGAIGYVSATTPLPDSVRVIELAE